MRVGLAGSARTHLVAEPLRRSYDLSLEGFGELAARHTLAHHEKVGADPKLTDLTTILSDAQVRMSTIYAELLIADIRQGTFSDALIALKAGRKVRRSGWNGKGMSVSLTVESEYLGGFFTMYLPNGRPFIWTPNTLDLLAEDWEIVPSIEAIL